MDTSTHSGCGVVFFHGDFDIFLTHYSSKKKPVVKGFIYSETLTHIYISFAYHASKKNPFMRQFFFHGDFDIILTRYSSKKKPAVKGYIYSETSTHVYIIYAYHSSKTNPVVRRLIFTETLT